MQVRVETYASICLNKENILHVCGRGCYTREALWQESQYSRFCSRHVFYGMYIAQIITSFSLQLYKYLINHGHRCVTQGQADLSVFLVKLAQLWDTYPYIPAKLNGI